MQVGTDDYHPGTLYQKKELEKIVWEKLGKAVFVLRETEGLSYDEIAKTLKTQPKGDKPMNQKQIKRLKALQTQWIDAELLADLYGIRLPDEALLGMFRAWAGRFKRMKVVEQKNQHYDRHALERCFQFHRLLPVRWAAARLGMERDSFEELLETLEQRSLIIRNIRNFTDQLVEESQVRDLIRLFPGLSDTGFSDHNDYCRNLHQAVQNDLGLSVRPIRCVTSETLGEDPPDYAYESDVITSEPIGVRYQVWLDLGKPICLKADACSLRLFAAGQTILSPFLMAGQAPEIPAHAMRLNDKGADE